MSFRKYQSLIGDAAVAKRVSKNDREWFPRWLRRYQSLLDVSESEDLDVSVGRIKQFSQSLLSSKTPAWQRL